MKTLPKKRSMLCLVSVAMLFIVLFVGPDTEALIRIDISSPGMSKYPAAIPPFKPLNGKAEEVRLSSELSKLLADDLTFTGYFKILDTKSALLGPAAEGITKQDIQFRAWSLMGADVLVTGGIASVANQINMELRLFDVARGELLLGKKYTGDLAAAERMIRRFGNDVIRLLTGANGYFGSRIAFVHGTGKHKDIYSMDFDGNNLRPETNYKILSLTPRWAPDGSRLAFISYKNGRPELFIKDMNSRFVRLVDLKSALNISPAWAPDGSSLAVTLSDRGRENIYLVDLQGKIRKMLTDRWGINVSSTWSPDGKRLAFVSDRAGSPQIYVKDMDSGSAKLLTYEGGKNVDPAWSPLGERIAFTRTVKGDFHVFTMNPDGRDVQQLTFSGSLNMSPCWSPDGTMLAFSSDRAGELAIYVMNANGSNQRRLTFLEGTQESPSWSPLFD